MIAIVAGIIIGLIAPEKFMVVVSTAKYILGQIIFFTIPLIIVGFIAPSITRLKADASKMLGITIFLAYLSSVGAAAFSTVSGYLIIPHLLLAEKAEKLREVPKTLIELNIPQIFGVMSALVLAILLGLAVVNTNSALPAM